jgi:hypothetical protein
MSGHNKDTCTLVFILVLFSIAKVWKQPRCLTTDEWIKKIWCVCTMEFSSVIRKNEAIWFEGKRMELRK